MEFGVNFDKEKFKLKISSDNGYDILGSLHADGFAMPLPHPQNWTHELIIENYANPFVVNEKIIMPDYQFSVKTTLNGVEVQTEDGKIRMNGFLENMKEGDFKKEKMPISISYLIQGNKQIFPFVADIVSMKFWYSRIYHEPRESISYQIIQPFLSKTKKEVENPVQVNWLPPLIKKQKEFLSNPPKSFDYDIIPTLESCSDFVETDSTCAGGFKPYVKGESLKKRSHNPNEFKKNTQIKKVVKRGGYLIPQDISIYGITNKEGIQKLEKVCEKFVKQYPNTKLLHPVDSDINPFEITINVYESNIPVTANQRFSKEEVKKLFEPYKEAREYFTQLLKQSS